MPDKEHRTLIIPNDVFFAQVCESLEDGHAVTFTVKGYSMFPFMRNEKDRVCLEKYDGRELPEGETESFGEMSPEAKNRISHRGKALCRLEELIRERHQSMDTV